MNWGALHSSQAAFISLAFYGHKNFIIIFNNLGKHIAASAVANQSFSTVFLCLLSEPHPPPPPPAPAPAPSFLSPGIYARRAFPALYMPPTLLGDGQNTDGHEIRTVEPSSRSQSANAVNHGAGKQATEAAHTKKTGRKQSRRYICTYMYSTGKYPGKL